MRKRDIQINYDMLAVLLTQLSNYQKAITNIIDSMDAVHNAVAADNDAESIKKLQKRYKKASKRLKDCRDEVIALHLLLNEYVKDMTAIIVPKSGMTRVSRNDIYWNKKSIQGAMETVKLLRSSIPYMPEDPYAYEEEEKQKMERNYNKIEQNIGANILDKLAGKMEEDIRKLDVYYEKVKDYENKDDEYRLKVFAVRQMYSSPWELFKQSCIDKIDRKWRMAKGSWKALFELITALYSVATMVYYGNKAKIAAKVALISYLTGHEPPKWTKDALGEAKDYFGSIIYPIMHPIETIESMADGLNQTLETEGLEYMFGYAVTDILIGKAAEGKFKGKKVTNKVDDAVEAVEDAGKAEKVKGVAEIGDDIEDLANVVTETTKKRYLDKVADIIDDFMRDAVSNDVTFDELVEKYKGKYTKKELAAAYTKYTHKKDQLARIDYRQILKEAGKPVKNGEHAHHIVYKKGLPGKMREIVDKAQDILYRYDIDPATDPHNLVSAPNKGHSIKNIQEVYDGLAKAEKDALEYCKKKGMSKAETKKYVKKKLYDELDRLGEIAAERK